MDFSGICRHGTSNRNAFWHNAFSGYIDGGSTQQLVSPEAEGFPAIETSALATKIHWDMLADVGYRKAYSEEYEMVILYPVFSNEVKQLNKREVSISGFMIPLNIKHDLYAISQNPYAACFFCGRSGPESVISLKFKNKPRRFRTDEYITVKGVMQLNDTNTHDLIYIFQNTEEVE